MKIKIDDSTVSHITDSFTRGGVMHKIKCWILRKIAGDMAVVINVDLSIGCFYDFEIDCTQLDNALLQDNNFNILQGLAVIIKSINETKEARQ